MARFIRKTPRRKKDLAGSREARNNKERGNRRPLATAEFGNDRLEDFAGHVLSAAPRRLRFNSLLASVPKFRSFNGL
jgi:hypothetical protein